MMMQNKWFFLVLGWMVLSVSCTEKMVTIPDYIPPTSDRVVLLEEFTGTKCPNCPTGAAVVEDLLLKYPDNLVAIGLHSNYLGAPVYKDGLDLRTEEANDIESFLGGWFGKPEAAFNRRHYDDQQFIRVFGLPDKWEGFLLRELETFAKVYLDIETQYDQDSRNVDITVTATAQEILSGQFNLHVFITESEIEAPQENSGSIIEDYKHKHVLRKGLTDISGMKWFSSLQNEATRTHTLSFTLPDEEGQGWWIPENCYVVAYVSDAATKEVLQAAEVHLSE